MQNRIIQRGNVLLAFDIQTGLVAYFDKTDYDLAVEATLLNKRNTEGGIFNNLRYPTVKSKTIHRMKMIDKREEGKAIHHKNELAYDNRESNLVILTKEEHAKIHNALPFNIRDYRQLGKDLTDKELIDLMRKENVFDETKYNPLTDMSYCQDLFFGYVAGILSEEEFLIKRLQYLAQNPFIIFYYGLTDLCDRYNISYDNYFTTESGAMHSKYNDDLELYAKKTFTPRFIFRQDVLPRLANLLNDDEFLNYYYYFMRSCNVIFDLQYMYHIDYFNEYYGDCFGDIPTINKNLQFKLSLDEAYQRFIFCKLDEKKQNNSNDKSSAQDEIEQSLDEETSSEEKEDKDFLPDIMSMTDDEFAEYLSSSSTDTTSYVCSDSDSDFLSDL